MRIHWPRLARLRLPGSVCLSVHLLVRLQLSALLYGGRSTYQCVSRRLGKTAHSALDIRQSPDSRPIPSMHLRYVYALCWSTCLLFVSFSCIPESEGNGRQEGKGSR